MPKASHKIYKNFNYHFCVYNIFSQIFQIIFLWLRLIRNISSILPFARSLLSMVLWLTQCGCKRWTTTIIFITVNLCLTIQIFTFKYVHLPTYQHPRLKLIKQFFLKVSGLTKNGLIIRRITTSAVSSESASIEFLLFLWTPTCVIDQVLTIG